MVKTVPGPPGPGLQDPPPGRYTARERAAALIRRRHLTPYLLLLPSVAVVGALVVWPAAQIGLFSFQNYGLPQVLGTAGTQWTGAANYSAILSDPEFWLSLRISLLFAVVVVPLTLVTGTLVGLLLNRLGRRMATFVSGAALLAWATPAVSASVIFVWLADPDGGIVDWTLSRLPSWLGGGAHWVNFSWTNAALPAYTLLTVLVLWQGFPFIAVSVLAGLKTIPAELHESVAGVRRPHERRPPGLGGATRRRSFRCGPGASHALRDLAPVIGNDLDGAGHGCVDRVISRLEPEHEHRAPVRRPR